MADRTERADVVVVGCGPGGAVLAFLLARSGVDVALVERASTFEREYRGFGWNPGVVRLFDEMGILDDVLDLAHERVTEGSFSLYGEELTVLDFDSLDTDYPYALMMEQPALLSYLVDRADAYDGFTFHPATTVTDLRVDDAGAVVGVLATDREAGDSVQFESRVVIGADGRYSTVRGSAGIDPGLFESPFDLVWFKLPRGAVEVEAQGRIDREGMLVYFGLGGGDLQVGLPILAGEWPDLRAAGFAAFGNRVGRIDPRVGAAIDDHLDGFGDTSLLDVAPGVADAWTADGLLLLGDAAHTASPIGAQGNPLAVEDAVVTHDLLVDALAADGGTLSAEVETLSTGMGTLSADTLQAFETRRRPHVERVISLQRRAGCVIAGWLQYGRYVPAWLVRGSTTALGRLPGRSRLPCIGPIRGLVESFALGDRSVSVARERFVD